MDTSSCCSICFEVLSSFERIIVKQELSDLLKFLIVNINVNILQDTLICEACLEKIQSACKFKNLFLKKLQETLPNVKFKETTDSETFVMCEMCKNINNQCDCVPLYDSIKELKELDLTKYLSTDLDLIQHENPQLCKLCHKAIINFYTITSLLCIFDQSKLYSKNTIVKQELDNECRKTDDSLSVTCSFVTNSDLKLQMKDESMTQEVDKQNECCEESHHKNEELDLKIEYDEGLGVERILELDKQEEIINTTLNNQNDVDENIKSRYKSGKTNKKIEMYNCQICDFKTKSKKCIQGHLRIHKNEKGLFKCPDCEYSTKRKDVFVRHMMVHKNINDIEMFKCEMCDYRTKNKFYLKEHELIHRNSDEIAMFQCELCEFQAKRKRYLIKHMIIHKKSEEEIYKCLNCVYKTYRKDILKIHMRSHNINEMFKCNLCAFKTKYSPNIRKHMLVHKQPYEVEQFKCEKCWFQTKHKHYITKHMRLHRDSNKVQVFRCKLCPFHTRYKFNLKEHMLIHKDSNEIEMFKCEMCQFQSKYKNSLTQHMRNHKTPDDLEIFQCLICSFKTKYKSYLRKHMTIHKKSLRCEICDFQTMHRYRFKRHMLIHENSSELKIFKCKVCDYITQRKDHFTRHMQVHKNSID